MTSSERKLNVMKKIILFGCLAALFSCREEDSGPGYNFKDQFVMGEIDGEGWRYQDGYAEINGDKIEITLMVAQEDGVKACDVFLPEGDQVFFTVPADKGLYKLGLNSSSRTVTMLDEEETLNHIADDGAIEILNISNSDIKGRIDARSDEEENYVNGDFRVLICK